MPKKEEMVEAPIVETSEDKVDEAAKANPVKEAKTNMPKEAKVGTAQLKDVDIHTTELVDCIVSGVSYKIKKDTNAKVPSDVAAILINSKQAYRV